MLCARSRGLPVVCTAQTVWVVTSRVFNARKSVLCMWAEHGLAHAVHIVVLAFQSLGRTSTGVFAHVHSKRRVLCAQVGMDDVNAAVVDHGNKPPRAGMMQGLQNNRAVQALTYVRMALGAHMSAMLCSGFAYALCHCAPRPVSWAGRNLDLWVPTVLLGHVGFCHPCSARHSV